MNRETGCEFASEIIKSARDNFLSQELQKHLQNCADCRETAKVTSFFQANLVKEFVPPKLPTAGLVWWKSKQREKILASEQITRTNLIAQISAIILVAAAIIGVLIFQPAYFFSFTDVLDKTFGALEQAAGYLLFVVGTFGTISIGTLLMMKHLAADK